MEEGQVSVLRDFIDGIPLSVVYSNLVPLGADGILAILSQIIKALRDAHRLGVIHGAVRLSNLILSPDAKVWTTDFGIPVPAALFKRNPPDDLVDIASNLCPEQLTQADIDERSDIFSLGIALHSLGALERPYIGQTVAEVREQMLSRPPLALREESGIDERLRLVVNRCMARYPQDRYQTVDAIEREINAAGFGHFDEISSTRFEDVAIRCGLEGVFPPPAPTKPPKPIPPAPIITTVVVEKKKPRRVTRIELPPVTPRVEIPPPVEIEPPPVAPAEEPAAAAIIPAPPEETSPQEFIEKYVRAWNQKAFLVEYECFKPGFFAFPSADYIQRRMSTYLRLTRGGRHRVTQSITRFPQVRKTGDEAHVLCVRQVQYPRRTELFVDSYDLERAEGEWRIFGVKSTPATEKELTQTIHMQMMFATHE